MEVFMKNIPPAALEKHVILALAGVLHGPDFRSNLALRDELMNFKISLVTQPRGQGGHKGCGYLILPSKSIGKRFLSYYGQPNPLKCITMGPKTVLFMAGTRAPRMDVVAEITRMPYVDPVEKEKQQMAIQQYESETIRVRTIQFGWECRDIHKIFSAEYEKECPDFGRMRFQDDPSEIHISANGSPVRTIIISLNQIYSASIGMSDSLPVIFFSLSEPPVFESEVVSANVVFAQYNLGKCNGQTVPPRQRHAAFDEGHRIASSYTSLALRLICKSTRDLQMFRRLAEIAGLQDYILPNPPQVERRRLFSPNKQRQFASWLRSVDWAVAFQLDGIARGLYLDLVELLSLRPDINAFYEKYGPRDTGTLLRQFRSEVKVLFYQDVDEEEGMETVAQCLSRCVEEYEDSPPKPIRVSRDTDNIFDCYHVSVTPTRYVLDGPYPERLNRVIRKYIEHSDCFVRVSHWKDVDG